MNLKIEVTTVSDTLRLITLNQDNGMNIDRQADETYPCITEQRAEDDEEAKEKKTTN